MRSLPAVLVGIIVALSISGPASAAECPGNPDALGVSRTIAIDPTEHTRLGTMQYRETLPLDDHEVVLTFDDGPLPPTTNKILDILAGDCLKATYFIIGRMAREHPEMVRRIYAAGHTIGTHSQNHPLSFQRMPLEKAQAEIDDGIASVAVALGDPGELAPFFRIPGLLRQEQVEDYLASHGLMAWSADFPADDWKHISASEIIRRALTRLEAKGRGILLLHDIHPATAAALPGLLKELKARGYRIVHVLPAGPGHPKTVTEPAQWVLNGRPEPWSDPVIGSYVAAEELPAPSPQSFGVAPDAHVAFPPAKPHHRVGHGHIPLPPESMWQQPIVTVAAPVRSLLPAPGRDSFGSGDPVKAPVAMGRRAASATAVRPASDESPTALRPSLTEGAAEAARILLPATAANRHAFP